MKLKVHEWGDGPKLALLIHGIMASAGTWQQVIPLMVERGYRVLAPDLRGHGESPYDDVYTPEAYAADLVDSLPTGADVAIGHSLGGLALSLAVAELRPAKAIYSDPAWKLAGNPMAGGIAAFALQAKEATPEQIQQMNPRWSEADVQAEVIGLQAWDVRTATGLPMIDRIPAKPIVPSLVQVADPSFLVTPELIEDLRSRGFEVRVVPATGHVIHRDDLEGFMASLDGWI